MYIEPEANSSYSFNNLGKTIYDQVLFTKPKKVVDFGILNGYSTICIAQALKENGFGKVYAYDLFEDYEFNRAKLSEVEKLVLEYGLSDWVEFKKVNFFDWIKNPESFDLLHLDISNTGDIIDMLWEKFSDSKATIIFEGGSEERDRVGWMVLHNKKPINKSKAKFEVINNRFPSISRLCHDQN